MDTEHFLFEEDSGLIIPTDGQYFRIYYQDNGTTTVLDTGKNQYVLNGRSMRMERNSSLEDWAGWIVHEPQDLRKALIDAIMTNGLNENPKRYLHYTHKNRGCSTYNPFIIADNKHYVRLEYALIAFIFELYPGRDGWIRLCQQNIIHENGRYYDLLQYVVISEEETHFEDYYFDITNHLSDEEY